jgi:hypothetical protein
VPVAVESMDGGQGHNMRSTYALATQDRRKLQ